MTQARLVVPSLFLALLSTSLSVGAQSTAPLVVIQGSGPVASKATESSHEFSRIAGVRELADGSVIAVDVVDQAILSVDFLTDKVTVVGRNGSGPGEYTGPRLVLPMNGDTSAVFDQRQWRWVFLVSSRMLTRTFSQTTNTFNQMRGFDRPGRLYYEATADMGGSVDSLPILRVDPLTGHVDTLAKLRLPKPRPLDETGGVAVGGFDGPFGRYGPYAPRDDWNVGNDGTIVIARASPFRVDRISPDGRLASGPDVTYSPIPVTQADKNRWAERYKTAKLIVPETNGKQRVITPSTNIEWPEMKPPFEPGAVRIAPDGTAWITRTTPASDSTQRIDLFDRKGEALGSVSVAAGLRLVGLGKTGIYFVREDSDGLQTLVRQNVTWPSGKN